MRIEDLRNYGKAFSDAEGSWPDDVKARMKQRGKAAVMRSLGLFDKLRFGWAFMDEKRKARAVDLSAIRARGMNNEVFLAQQIEYICLFKALVRVVGTERAVQIGKAIMDAASVEPMLLAMPEPDKVRALGDTMKTFAAFFRASLEPSEQQGSHLIQVSEDTPDAFQFDIQWCVWLELARAFDVPEACLPNCYSDDLIFPEYYRALGIRYSRSGTLAQGARCCDFRFERIED